MKRTFLSILLVTGIGVSTGCSPEILTALNDVVSESTSSDTEKASDKSSEKKEEASQEDSSKADKAETDSSNNAKPTLKIESCLDALMCMAESSSAEAPQWKQWADQVKNMLENDLTRSAGKELCEDTMEPKVSKECQRNV